DSTRSEIGFRWPPNPQVKVAAREGGFLDLRTLAHALSGEGHGLVSACKAFGVLDPRLLELALTRAGLDPRAAFRALGLGSVRELAAALRHDPTELGQRAAALPLPE